MSLITSFYYRENKLDQLTFVSLKVVLLDSGKNEFLRELDKGHQRTSNAPLELQLFQGNISKWHFWFNPTDELYIIT